VEVESQENFLRELDPVETANHLASASADVDMGNRILRTDVVTISYDRQTIEGKIDEARAPSRTCDDLGHGWVKL
jgi:bacillopeptidase F (M6 metalloprotease family)